MSNLKISVAAMALALAGGAHATGFTDGTFSEGALAGGYQTINAGNWIGTSWDVTSGSVDVIGSYWQAPTAGGFSIDLDGNSPGTITQSFTVAAGEYTLGFWLAANPDGGQTTKNVEVTVGGSDQTFHFTPTASDNESSMGYTFETLTFTTAGATSLTFKSLDDASSPYGAAIGGISVTAVPEPASMALLLAGLGMVGVMAARRRSR